MTYRATKNKNEELLKLFKVYNSGIKNAIENLSRSLEELQHEVELRKQRDSSNTREFKTFENSRYSSRKFSTTTEFIEFLNECQSGIQNGIFAFIYIFSLFSFWTKNKRDKLKEYSNIWSSRESRKIE